MKNKKQYLERTKGGIKELCNRIKELAKNRNNVYAIIIIGILIVISFSYTCYKNDTSKKVLQEFENSISTQYKQQIKEKNIKIQELTKSLNQSESRYKNLQKKIKDLKNENEKIKVPITVKDLRDRFDSLGYSSH